MTWTRMSFQKIMNMLCVRYHGCRKSPHRVLCQRRCSLTKALVSIVFITLVVLLVLNYNDRHLTVKSVDKPSSPPLPITVCSTFNHKQLLNRGPNNHSLLTNLKIHRRVLIMTESHYSRNAKSIVSAIEMARFPYKVVSDEKNLPTLTHLDTGRFGVIIFETLQLYLSLDYWNKQLIDKYCRDYGVGVIFFTKSSDENEGMAYEQLPELALSVQYHVDIQNYRLNVDSAVWRIVRPGEVINHTLRDWTVFKCNNSLYEPLAMAENSEDVDVLYGDDSKPVNVTVAVLDKGLIDGIKRILIGNDFSFWLHSPILLDSISYLSHGKLSLPLERYMQIDIDDIFVGAKGTRMQADDVEALAAAQTRLQKHVDGFRFLLGFSGWYFQHGTEEENEGDRLLLTDRYKKQFHWFPHMWCHEQPHKYTEEELERNMYHNYNFAKEHELRVDLQYAVAPHHSGVFPVHEPLYKTWKSVWNVRVTSTEEYPRLNPSWGRRGFIHSNILVLPRQTCGLFTHTIMLDSYPGGRGKLDRSIHGGDLFRSFLYNPFNIFMTHLANYGNDRLALYTFESAVKFVRCWTNLQLQQVTPIQMGMKYFDIHPEEQSPVWRNPCSYERHYEIWSENKTCDRLPKFLVVGPQKTGTTALYTFLGMHPAVKSNFNNRDTYEELQFFNGKNYLRGIDWYMSYFPKPQNLSAEFLFEKSANYFDSSLVPGRVHALLPNANIICILTNPAKRAYSWYQHMQAHKDPVAMNYTFYDVITSSDTTVARVKALRNRCLNPGLYEHHLLNWLDYFSARQLYIIDGDQLRTNPVQVIEKLQKFLRIEPSYDYSKSIRFDNTKGFYCQVGSGGKNKCLGRSKGRHYPPMDSQSEEYLRHFFSKHNFALSKLLNKMHVQLPDWLEEELGHT